MDKLQLNFIIENKTELIRLTTCHSLFIAYLQSKNILADSDIVLLDSIQNRSEKTTAFYDIIVTRENFFLQLCKALEKTDQSGALEILKRLTAIRFDVRPPAHFFTGRKEELMKLHQHLTSGSTSGTLITQSASVSGLGGIGKTELCRRYIQKYSDDYDGNVIWVTAENPAYMAHSFKILAKDHLNVSLKDADGGEKNIKTVVDEVYNYFWNKKCLFVFDNALSANNLELETFMPFRVERKPHFIITSRDKSWELPLKVLVLEELKEIEAIEFVKKGLAITDKFADVVITELVTVLQKFPLALQQAISFIRHQRSTGEFEIREYLNLFKTQSNLLLNYNMLGFLTNQYSKTTFTTWKITTSFITADENDGDLAMRLLYKLSYFEPEKIVTSTLTSNPEETKDDIHAALQLLVQYSMINSQPNMGTLSIHRLVQEVTRAEVRKSRRERETLWECLRLFQSDINPNSIAHAISVFEFSSKYKFHVTEFSFIPSNIIGVNRTSLVFTDFKAFGERALGWLQKHLPDTHIDIIDIEFELAVNLFSERKFAKAIQAFQTILSKYMSQENPAEVEYEILTTKRFIAQSLRHLGKFEESLDLSSNVLQQQKALVGTEDVETIRTTNAIFANLLDSEKIPEALLLCNQVLETCNDSSNSELLSIQSATSERPIILDAAVEPNCYISKLCEKMTKIIKLNIRYRYLGMVLNRYLSHQGRHSEAVKITSTLYNCTKIVYGADHNDTIEALCHLGISKKEGGYYKEAVSIFENVDPEFLEFTGSKHWLVYVVKISHAISLSKIGSFEQALSILCELFDTYLEYFGPYDRIVLAIFVGIAEVMRDMGAFQDSLDLFKEAEKIAKKEPANSKLAIILKAINELKDLIHAEKK